MPRPNPAQLAYGSATVILSALVMLLVTQARSGVEVVVVASVALALGLIVAVTAPAGRAAHRPRPVSDGTPDRRGAARVEDEQRVPQPSLRR
ncbi:hypothetical protein [Streptomyces macrosporus]|uniref:Secreted protein n=1 Tax=Streptomyces macrosporus TaxID=44032 RepID=A0ABP5WPH6_9ACTN